MIIYVPVLENLWNPEEHGLKNEPGTEEEQWDFVVYVIAPIIAERS